MERYALITGASKGIGSAIAHVLAQKGYSLLIVARSATELEQVSIAIKDKHAVGIHYLAADLSTSDGVQQVITWVADLGVPLSILINNAGYGVFGKFADRELNEHLDMLNLNINAVISLTHQLLPALKSNPPAYILNVASTAAYQAVPALTAYAASKAFVLSYSRGLRYELKDTNVSVSCLCPGPTATNFSERAGMGALAHLAEKFDMQADEVARIGIKGMFDKDAEIIPGFLNRVGAAGARLLNKSVVERIGARLYKL